MRVAKAEGHLRGKQPKLDSRQEAHLVEATRLATRDLVNRQSGMSANRL